MTNTIKFTPGPWKIHPISTDMGEFIIGKSLHDDRPCEVVCTGILNPYDSQLIAVAPNMHAMLKYISGLIETDPEEIVTLKEPIASILRYIDRERNVDVNDQ